MSLATLVSGALTTIMTSHPECVVTVKSNGVSASGFRRMSKQTSGVDEMGGKGLARNAVEMKVADMARPDDGATIIVGSDTCEVTETRIDPTGAIMAIEYIITKPVTEDEE